MQPRVAAQLVDAGGEQVPDGGADLVAVDGEPGGDLGDALLAAESFVATTGERAGPHLHAPTTS